MLKRLTITQFVIIDRLSLDFKAGLTVMTGETGAGKSILIDALGQILGDPPARKSIRQGSYESMIEAAFTPATTHPVWNVFAKHHIPGKPGEDVIIRRTVGVAEKDEIVVNEKQIDIELLKEIGAYLVEIHGQFANQNLLAPARQLSLLDAFGSYPPNILGDVAKDWHDILRLMKELEEERTFVARFTHEQPKIERLVDQFNDIGMQQGFYEDIKAEHHRLVNIKDTDEIFQSIHSQLVASNGIEQALVKCNHVVARQKYLDSTDLEPLSQHLATALESTRKAIDEMAILMPKYNADMNAIREHEEKLNIMRKMASEHKIEPEHLFDLFEEYTAKLTRIRNARALIARIETDLDKTKASYLEHAHLLTEERTKAAHRLSLSITDEMPPLKLTNGQFEVNVSEKIHNTAWSEIGFNEVAFTARMNPGMPFSQVAETASGGELARLILALKVVLQRVQTTSTLVFDEIDSGIDGAAAAAVGERIARLSGAAQILVVTHSPQVAARGKQHMHVSKKTDGVTTETIVSGLIVNQRIDEIARMMAGDSLTPESRAAAKSLIDEAGRLADARAAAGRH